MDEVEESAVPVLIKCYWTCIPLIVRLSGVSGIDLARGVPKELHLQYKYLSRTEFKNY